MEERDLDILVEARAKRMPNKFRNFGILGFLLIVVGGIVELSGKIYGFGVMGLGAIIMGVAVVISSRIVRGYVREIKEHYQNYKVLPPWPDEGKK